jgi:ribosomal protein L7/L12
MTIHHATKDSNVAGAMPAPAEQEKFDRIPFGIGQEFTVVLFEPVERKIEVIKEIHELTGLGLKEVKALVESKRRMKPIWGGLTEDEAEAITTRIVQIGADAGYTNSKNIKGTGTTFKGTGTGIFEERRPYSRNATREQILEAIWTAREARALQIKKARSR